MYEFNLNLQGRGVYPLPKNTGLVFPPPPTLTLHSPLKRGPGVLTKENFWIPIIILVHSDSFWDSLLVDYMYELCCNSVTVYNSLQAEQAYKAKIDCWD